MADRRRKLVERILRNPKDVSFEEVRQVLEAFDYECRQPSGGGSHYTFRKPGTNPITVPKNKPVKEVYIKNIIRLLDLENWYEKNS